MALSLSPSPWEVARVVSNGDRLALHDACATKRFCRPLAVGAQNHFHRLAQRLPRFIYRSSLSVNPRHLFDVADDPAVLPIDEHRRKVMAHAVNVSFVAAGGGAAY